MKIHVYSPDEQQRVDPCVQNQVIDHLPDRVSTIEESDVIVMPVSPLPGFRNRVTDPDLHHFFRGKPIVVLDYMEYYGLDVPSRGNLIGRKGQWMSIPDGEYKALAAVLADDEADLIFKRELHQEDAGAATLPAEWLCLTPAQPIASKAEFSARPIEVFSAWGYSHESRPRVHGRIFQGMATDDLRIISDWHHFDGYRFEGRTWASIFSPHYVRVPIDKILRHQGQSKISLSLPGAGIKCFRHAEAPVNAVMALQEDSLAWSFPWVHGQNCLRLRHLMEFEDLLAYSAGDLYDLYRAGVENVDRYRPHRYVNEYLIPKIKEIL